jgi:hypothetical protein
MIIRASQTAAQAVEAETRQNPAYEACHGLSLRWNGYGNESSGF